MDQKLISGEHLQGTRPGSMSFYVLIISNNTSAIQILLAAVHS